MELWNLKSGTSTIANLAISAIQLSIVQKLFSFGRTKKMQYLCRAFKTT
jgi:hypothetical protein